MIITSSAPLTSLSPLQRAETTAETTTVILCKQGQRAKVRGLRLQGQALKSADSHFGVWGHDPPESAFETWRLLLYTFSTCVCVGGGAQALFVHPPPSMLSLCVYLINVYLCYNS